MDRKRIQVLLALVGAKASERLSKINTTMLVSLKPEGPKYESAVQWRVPIVTVDWLYKSVIDGKLENPEQGTDLVRDSTTTAPLPKEDKYAKHITGHPVAETSSTMGIAGAEESNAARTNSDSKLQTGTGNAETSIKEVDAAQDAITTAAPRIRRDCEDIIIEQPEPNSQAIPYNASCERRIVRGSQPLPLEHSASVAAPPPASQGPSLVVEHSTTHNDQAMAETNLDMTGNEDRTNESRTTEQGQHETDRKRASGDLDKFGREYELNNKSLGSVPNEDKSMGSNPATRGLALDAACESPRDASRSLKRSLSDSQVTDSGGKENLQNICPDDVAHPATAPEVRSEPMCSAPASTSVSSTQRQKPDLSLLVKDFKRKFQKKVETPREHAHLPAASAQGMSNDSFSHSATEQRRVTRSEVERDTTDRPGESVNENGKRSRQKEGADGLVLPGDADSKRVSRRHRIEAATASEVQQRLTARKLQQQSMGSSASASLAANGGNSDDEDMYAESQMVVYDRSFGATASGSSSNISMPPPPKQQKSLPTGPDSSPKSANKSSPGAQTRRATRSSSSGGAAGLDSATSATAESPKSTDATPRVFMMSGLTTEMKKSLTHDIKRLGGTVSTKNAWDKRCTHLITDEVKRVEKTLAACAAGRWVVTHEYIKASLRAKRFVDEKHYEHSAPGGKRDDDSHAHRNNELLPDAPHRCRILRATVPALDGGLFSGMKALVTLADNSKTKIVVHVLESGGAAQVVTCSGVPSKEQLKAATAVFVDAAQIDGMKKQTRKMAVSVYTSDNLAGLISHGRFDDEDGLYKLE
jgi:hypothetical protein